MQGSKVTGSRTSKASNRGVSGRCGGWTGHERSGIRKYGRVVGQLCVGFVLLISVLFACGRCLLLLVFFRRGVPSAAQTFAFGVGQTVGCAFGMVLVGFLFRFRVLLTVVLVWLT